MTFKKNRFISVLAGLFAGSNTVSTARDVGRVRTRDVAFTFRMGAGFPGDVNRVDSAKIEPCLIDASAPPTAYGQPVVVDATTQGVRPLVAGDAALDAVYGFTVRPYPTQQSTSGVAYAGVSIGGAAPPPSGIIDILRSGYIMTQLGGGAGVVKGGRVFIWVAASAGNHVQGQVEAVATGGSTIELDEKSYFNGPADANGVVEISFNI